MTRKYPSIDIMVVRMKPLPPRHRIAHLRALLHREPQGSTRRVELAALLRHEMTPPPANEDRAP
jgi:hypothetical protein